MVVSGSTFVVRAKPHWKKSHKCYYLRVCHKGKDQFIRLSPDKVTAWRLYHQYLGRSANGSADGSADGPEHRPTRVTIKATADEFLTGLNLKASTVSFYRRYVESFAEFTDHSSTKLVKDLEGRDVEAWLGKVFPQCGPTAKYNAVRAVRRYLGWCVLIGYLDKRPVVKCPTPRSREGYVDADSFAKLVAAASGQDFVRPSQNRPQGAFIRQVIVERKPSQRATVTKRVGERREDAVRVAFLEHLRHKPRLFGVNDVRPLAGEALSNDPWVASWGHTTTRYHKGSRKSSDMTHHLALTSRQESTCMNNTPQENGQGYTDLTVAP